MNFLINHFYIFLAIIFGVISQLIIKWKMNGYSLDNYETLYDKFIFAFSMLLNPYIMVSLVFTLLAGVTWMIAMTKFDISYAYPFTSLGFVLVFVFSIFLYHEPVNMYKIIGVLLIIAGIAVSSRGM